MDWMMLLLMAKPLSPQFIRTSIGSFRVNHLNLGILVPEAGLEPAHHLWRRILSPVRLPIPPLRQRAFVGS
jgi:hypothetical protein